jgi:hypothetical protein
LDRADLPRTRQGIKLAFGATLPSGHFFGGFLDVFQQR